jgi:hypothetical protein
MTWNTQNKDASPETASGMVWWNFRRKFAMRAGFAATSAAPDVLA